MSAFLVVLLCCVGIGYAQVSKPTPLKAMKEFMLAHHPASVGFRNRIISDSPRVAGRGYKDAVMSDLVPYNRGRDRNTRGRVRSTSGPAYPRRGYRGRDGSYDDGYNQVDGRLGYRGIDDLDPGSGYYDRYERSYSGGRYREAYDDTYRNDIIDLPGISEPLGFWDPLGFSRSASDERIRFYREAELKHGRLAMLATVGILAAEKYQSLPAIYSMAGRVRLPFPGNPLQTFLFGVLFGIVFALPEVFTLYNYQRGSEYRYDYGPDDVGFDPLNLRPTDPIEFEDMQTRELNNGRLAMIAFVGMVAQELSTGQKLFPSR